MIQQTFDDLLWLYCIAFIFWNFFSPQSNLHSFDYKTKHLKNILLKYITGKYRVTAAISMHFLHIALTGFKEPKWEHYSSFFNLAKQVSCNLTVPERQPWLQNSRQHRFPQKAAQRCKGSLIGLSCSVCSWGIHLQCQLHKAGQTQSWDVTFEEERRGWTEVLFIMTYISTAALSETCVPVILGLLEGEGAWLWSSSQCFSNAFASEDRFDRRGLNQNTDCFVSPRFRRDQSNTRKQTSSNMATQSLNAMTFGHGFSIWFDIVIIWNLRRCIWCCFCV